MNLKKTLWLLPFFTLFLLSAKPVGDPKIDVTEFIRDTQKWVKDDDGMKLTWWIPTEYWKVSLEGNPDVSPRQMNSIIDALEPYVVICVASLESEKLGKFKSVSEDKMRRNLRLKDANDKEYKPIPEDDLEAGLAMLSGSLKPAFAQMLGDVGKGMHIFFFEVKDKKGNNLIAATEEGKFTVKHSGSEFSWSLPLPVLMPAKHCPVDDAEMRGDWKFCPYHGEELK